MAANKLRLQSFRTNDLINDGGKQFELGKSWCDDFFEFDKTLPEVVVNLKFKAIQADHVLLNDKIIELKLADVSTRGDRKAYVNGNNGMSQIKDFFINDLHLTPDNNLTDYFAIYKVSEFDYFLYFVPSILYKNFLQFFKSVLPTVSINHNKEHSETDVNTSLQQIFYGAPGTGKSHEIKVQTKGKSVIRTTFHPDSDYSTFVGCYKPTIGAGRVYGAQGPLTENGKPIEEPKITYKYVIQAFLKAYLGAWKKYVDREGYEVAPQFLIIEEINRGNCAQIFGDLFQLLDRGGNGFSEYLIEADSDLQQEIERAFNEEKEYKLKKNIDVEGIIEGYTSNYGSTLSEDIQHGRVLLLPNNLYIWATMNTSDQSLFPIDSAFKRRWDWVYIPIADAKKNYVIEIDNDQYDWWSFLEAINAIIESTIHSEDKKLGYFFAKAKDGRITVETFVSKVIFYLWNDVFKDNETNHKAFKDNDGELLPFRKFFNHDGTVDTNMVIKFLQDLEVYPFETSEDGTMVSDTTPNTKRQRDKSRYVVNGKDGLNKAQMTREAFRLYIEAHPDADAQTIAKAWNGLGLKDYVRHLVETEAEFNARTKDSTDTNKRATEFELSNGEKIYLSTQFGIGNIDKFIDAINNAGWNIRIENQD